MPEHYVTNGSTITGDIDSTIDSNGTINFGAGTEVTGAVGANNANYAREF
ncbi:hypothetical protein [Candidatus Rickettsia kedanie]